MQTIADPEFWRASLTLILAALIIMGSPGPSTISATAVGAAYGFRRSLPYVSGLVAGATVVLLAVAVGIVTILLSIPHSASTLVAVSAVYITYLALRIATAPPLASPGDHAATPAFTGGFLLAIANPKAYLAIAGVFAGTTIIQADHARDAAVKTMLLAVMIVLIHLVWLLAGASLSRVLKHPVGARIINIGLAAILVTTAALTIWR